MINIVYEYEQSGFDHIWASWDIFLTTNIPCRFEGLDDLKQEWQHSYSERYYYTSIPIFSEKQIQDAGYQIMSHDSKFLPVLRIQVPLIFYLNIADGFCQGCDKPLTNEHLQIDPYAHDVYDDDTLVYICDECAYDRLGDI
jgi:hypothetical protein